MAHRIVCYGEVLWDIFPDYQKIGGAPLNVALRLNSFGNEACMISSVGKDELGDKLLEFVSAHGLDTSMIQKHLQLGTGAVQVSLDEGGSASYEIMHPKAWDRIQFRLEDEEAVKNSKAFIFGSLIARDQVSKSTLYKLLEHADFKVFDVNLRPPHYQFDALIELMEKADFLKLNDEELILICEFMGSESEVIEDNIEFLSKATSSESICVTKGGKGAVLYEGGIFHNNPGYKVVVADTVGAGDSFLATLIHHLLHGTSPSQALDYACAVGALVASNEGANPSLSKEDIFNFMSENL